MNIKCKITDKRLLLRFFILALICLMACDADETISDSAEVNNQSATDTITIEVQSDSIEDCNDSLVIVIERIPYEERYTTAENTTQFLIDEIYSDSTILVIGGDRIDVLDAPFGEIVTQAEYLEPVIIIDRDSIHQDWCMIELPIQRGYFGYVKRSDIIQLRSGPYEGVAIVSVPITTATGAPGGGVNLRELRGATALPICLMTRDYMQTELEEGLCWILLDDVQLLSESILPSSEEIISIARDMLGSEYVWGGTTWGSMDCSGFVNLVLRMNGYLIKRDCGIEFADSSGCIITKAESGPGDLIYISTYKPGASHVGILTGNGMVIHCGSNGVSEIPITGGTFSSHEVVGYKRFTE